MFLADGFEEAEALVTLDLMRRADINVKTVGIGSDTILGTHSIRVFADMKESDFDLSECEGIILPGGMHGTENLYENPTVIKALEYCFENKKLIAAICAAPIIPGRKGMLKSLKAVCFPGFEDELLNAEIKNSPCVSDDSFITAKGAGCVFEFAHAIIRYVINTETADKIISVIQHDKIS